MKEYAITVPAFVDMIVKAEREADAIRQITHLLSAGVEVELELDTSDVEFEDFCVRPSGRDLKPKCNNLPHGIEFNGQRSASPFDPKREPQNAERLHEPSSKSKDGSVPYEAKVAMMTEIVREIRNSDLPDRNMGILIVSALDSAYEDMPD